MGAQVGPKSGGAKSDINVTPLIDIVLVLLIVFIVMVPGLTKAAKVTVPQVVQTTTPPPPPNPNDVPIVITVTENGKYMLQSDEIEVKDLGEKLLAPIKLQPITGRKVTLKIDEEAKYQLAVDALDQIRMTGDRAKKETAADPRFQGLSGDDIKVLISMKKK